MDIHILGMLLRCMHGTGVRSEKKKKKKYCLSMYVTLLDIRYSFNSNLVSG